MPGTDYRRLVEAKAGAAHSRNGDHARGVRLQRMNQEYPVDYTDEAALPWLMFEWFEVYD
jgi:hypothetical protein